MMAKNPRVLDDHRAVELIMSSVGPGRHKQSVRNFGPAVWDREK